MSGTKHCSGQRPYLISNLESSDFRQAGHLVPRLRPWDRLSQFRRLGGWLVDTAGKNHRNQKVTFWADTPSQIVENLNTCHVVDPLHWRSHVHRRAGSCRLRVPGYCGCDLASERSRKVRMLPWRCPARRVSESQPSGDRWDTFGQLPVHVAGHPGVGPSRNPDHRTGQHAGTVLLASCTQAEDDSTRLQSFAGHGVEFSRIRGVQAGRDLCAACARPPGVGRGGHHSLRLQHGGDVNHHWADGRQAGCEGLDGQLSVVVSLLHGRRGCGRVGELPQSPHRMAVFVARASTDLPDVSLLPSVSGKTRDGKEACGAGFKPAPADH